MIEIKSNCILKFVNFSKKTPYSCHLLHTKCETIKSKPMHKTQKWNEGSFLLSQFAWSFICEITTKSGYNTPELLN